MSKIAFHRALAGFVARSAIGLSGWGGADAPTMDGKIKAPPSAGARIEVIVPGGH